MCQLELKELAFEAALNRWAEAHKKIAKKIKKKEAIYKKEWEDLEKVEQQLNEIKKEIGIDISKIYDIITGFSK